MDSCPSLPCKLVRYIVGVAVGQDPSGGEGGGWSGAATMVNGGQYQSQRCAARCEHGGSEVEIARGAAARASERAATYGDHIPQWNKMALLLWVIVVICHFHLGHSVIWRRT